MSSAAIWVVMAAVAVEFGYEPMPDGDGLRYVFQVEPEMLDMLQRGEPVGSTIPPEALGRIREIRIVSNYGLLSKDIPPLADKPTFPTMTAEQPWTTPTTGNPTESAPNLLDPNLVNQASGVDEGPATAGPSGTLESEKEPIEEPKSSKPDPWLLFVLASVIAVGSSSGMLVFGWLTFDYRSRYLELLRESVGTGNAWLDAAADSEPIGSKLVDLPIESETTAPQSSADLPPGGSPWEDLGVESKESVDDWLHEDGDQRGRSRHNRKKSR